MKKNHHTKKPLKLVVVNPPTKEQKIKLVEEISKMIKLNYYQERGE